MKTIRTKRLKLRRFKYSDLDDLYEYAKDERVGPNAGWKPHQDKEESLKYLKSFIEEKENWAIYHREDKKLIGSIGLNEDSFRRVSDLKARELGFVLSPDYWGKRIAIEAGKAIIDYGFNNYKLDIISASHFDFNDQSRKVIRRLGFEQDGKIRRYIEDEEAYIDLYIYSILREDFLKNT